MSLPELPTGLEVAARIGGCLNRRGEEQNTGLGILIKQTRLVYERSLLEEPAKVLRADIADKAQEKLAELAAQFVDTFEATLKLSSQKRMELIRQVQEEIVREAKEEIARLAAEWAPKEPPVNDISLPQLLMALVGHLATPRPTYTLQIAKINTILVTRDKLLRRLVSDDIVLDIKLDPELGWASFDPGAIIQVICNLVVNANEAMPGGGHLTIETSNIVLDENNLDGYLEVHAGEYVLLTVRDTGFGMSSEIKKHLFEPFFTTKSGDHKGFGLAQVFNIIHFHSGQIRVHSEVGIGTSVEIFLPRIGPLDPEPNPFEVHIRARNLVQRMLADSPKEFVEKRD